MRLLTTPFHKFVTELSPLIDVRNLVSLNILIMNRQNRDNFVYAFILANSRFGLLMGIFHKFVHVPLIDIRIVFLFYILRINRQHLPNVFTLQKMCYVFCLSREKWYRKSMVYEMGRKRRYRLNAIFTVREHRAG